MPSPAAAYKAAQEQALRASAALQAAMGGTIRIYTEVPVNAPLPYIVIGADEITKVDLPEDCGEAHSIYSEIQWWTKSVGDVPGSVVARLMGDAIVTVHSALLAIAGHETVLWDMEEPESYRSDPDQSTRGRTAFRYETTALA